MKLPCSLLAARVVIGRGVEEEAHVPEAVVGCWGLSRWMPVLRRLMAVNSFFVSRGSEHTSSRRCMIRRFGLGHLAGVVSLPGCWAEA